MFLLFICCTVLVTCLKVKSDPKITEEARRQMKKCKEMGYDQPDTDQLLMMDSDVDVERTPDSPTTLLTTLANVLEDVSDDGSPSNLLDSLGKTGPRTMASTSFRDMIKKIKNASNATKCFLNAVMAPMAWNIINSQENANLDPMEFQDYVSTIEQGTEMLPRRLELPQTISEPNMEILMNTLKEKYQSMSKQQISQVMKWAQKKIEMNCTAPRSEECRRFVARSAVRRLGPYISYMPAAVFKLIPQQDLCEFIKSDKLRQIKALTDRLKPSKGRMIVNKIKNCTTLMNNLDRLGRLACYYDHPELTPDQKMKLLSKISECPGQAKWKKKLMQSIPSDNVVESIKKLGSAARYLPKNQLKGLSKSDVVAVLNNTNVNFTRGQMRVLVKKYLGNTTCRGLSKRELDVVLPVMKAVPNCIVKKTFQTLTNNTEAVKNMLKHMPENIEKSKAATIGKKLMEELNAIDYIDMLPARIVQAIPIEQLRKTKSFPLNKVKRTKWTVPQALIWTKMMTVKTWFRNIGSLISGVTCKMIENTEVGNVKEMVQGLADASGRLSKVQAMCAALKLFKTLAMEKPNYFESISAEELSQIPTVSLIYLSPNEIKNLPDKMCPEFLKKMNTVDLTSLPERSLSRYALMKRALRCLGQDLSTLSSEDMDQLGPLICQMPPLELRRLKEDTRKYSLQALDSCDYIPENHTDGVVQMVSENFGNSRNWNDTTVEEMSTLLFLNKTTKPQLPEQMWMKYALPDILQRLPKHLRKLHKDFIAEQEFKYIVSENEAESPGTETRRKREASPRVPTPELIRELGELNQHWTFEELNAMSLETFIETVEILGNVTKYSPEQLNALRNKTVEAFGLPQNMNESVVTQLGCIAQCFTSDQVKNMAFSQSSLTDIASCRWNHMQIPAVWKGVAKHNSLSARSLDFSDIVEIDRFICGLNSTEIQQLNVTAFRDAVGSINTMGCTVEELQQFRGLLVDTFGNTNSWTEDAAAVVGAFAAGLNAVEMAFLDPSLFSYFTLEAVRLFPASNLAALSVAQLTGFGPDNAAEVTEEQKALMSVEQKSALQQASQGTRQQPVPGSGAAEMLGMSMKLLVSLMLGLMLL